LEQPCERLRLRDPRDRLRSRNETRRNLLEIYSTRRLRLPFLPPFLLAQRAAHVGRELLARDRERRRVSDRRREVRFRRLRMCPTMYRKTPPRFVFSLVRSLARSLARCISKDTDAALHGARQWRLTNCLCLSPAIFRSGYCFAERDRPNERTRAHTKEHMYERRRASISQAATLRPRSHGACRPMADPWDPRVAFVRRRRPLISRISRDARISRPICDHAC